MDGWAVAVAICRVADGDGGGWTCALEKLPRRRLVYWSPPVSGALTLSRFWRLKFNNELWAVFGFRTGRANGFIFELLSLLYILEGGRVGASYPSPSMSVGLPRITPTAPIPFLILLFHRPGR